MFLPYHVDSGHGPQWTTTAAAGSSSTAPINVDGDGSVLQLKSEPGTSGVRAVDPTRRDPRTRLSSQVAAPVSSPSASVGDLPDLNQVDPLFASTSSLADIEPSITSNDLDADLLTADMEVARAMVALQERENNGSRGYMGAGDSQAKPLLHVHVDELTLCLNRGQMGTGATPMPMPRSAGPNQQESPKKSITEL